MEKNFKKGDRFTPHKPKDVNEYPLWQPCMDLLNGKTLVIENITSNGEISAECCLFHPDWCEKVEENQSVETNEMVEERFPDIRKTIDWEQRRYELVKEIMLVDMSNYFEKDKVLDIEEVVESAIIYADEIIKRLKQE